MSQLAWFIGLITFVCLAVLGQAELIGEPWRHYVTVLAVVCTAITGYMLQHPWNGVERRQGARTDDNTPTAAAPTDLQVKL